MTNQPSRNEQIKEASDYLRGTLAEGLRAREAMCHVVGRGYCPGNCTALRGKVAE